MSTRRRRGKAGRHGNVVTPILLGAGIILVLALLLVSGVFKNFGGGAELKPTAGFRVADYRKDGSRFAAEGNQYIFKGRVESIDSYGGSKIVTVSLEKNTKERLPLLVPAKTRLRMNLTRGDRFLFTAKCMTGKQPDGTDVKGVFVVREVESL